MAIVRVDLDTKEEPKTGWQWENTNGYLESLVVDALDVLCFVLDGKELFQIDKTEIKYWLKALKEAEKYFEEDV